MVKVSLILRGIIEFVILRDRNGGRVNKFSEESVERRTIWRARILVTRPMSRRIINSAIPPLQTTPKVVSALTFSSLTGWRHVGAILDSC